MRSEGIEDGFTHFCQFRKAYKNQLYEAHSYFMFQLIAAFNLDLGVLPDYSWILKLCLLELLTALKLR